MSDDSDDVYSSGSDGEYTGRRRGVRSNRARVKYSGFGDGRDDDDVDFQDRTRKRATRSRNHDDDEEDDDDSRSQTPTESEPIMEIETLVARRNGETGDVNAVVGPFDYLVKWKDMSYLHLEWVSGDDLISWGGQPLRMKINRYNANREKGILPGKEKVRKKAAAVEEKVGEDDDPDNIDHWSASGDLYDPALIEIEKILACRTVDDAVAPPPAPLPVDPLADAPDTSSSPDSEAQPSQSQPPQPKLAETDIVPGTNMTLAQLRFAHECYSYPPYRQAIFVRDMRRLAESRPVWEQKLAVAERLHEANMRPLREELQNCLAMQDPELIDALRAKIEAKEHQFEAEVAETKAEIKRIDDSGAMTLRLQARECFLVKWKGASYKTASWEWSEDVQDDVKISLFRRIETPPSGVRPLLSRQQQAAKKREIFQEEGIESTSAPAPAKSSLMAELDKARFRRAAETLPPLRVPAALVPYALQLEVSGLAQKEDEIICVNGVRCTGMRTEEIHKLIRDTTSEVRVLRFLRRETGQELEIKFDPQKRMGFVMDELHKDAQHSQTVSWMQRMSQRKRSTVEYSARIKKFPTPDAYEGGNRAPIQDNVNPALRSAVLAVFSAREALSPLTLEKWSLECGVDVEYLHKWLLKDVPDDEQLKANEQIFQSWLVANVQAFSCAPGVEISKIEGYLVRGNPNRVVLPAGADEDVHDAARSYAKSLLVTVYNELLGTASRFEAEARRQKADFYNYSMSNPNLSPELRNLINGVSMDDNFEDPDEVYEDEADSGASIQIQQQRRIQTLQSGASKFVAYGPNNLPRFKNNNMLREYQLQGVNWLVSKWYEGKNCILADEMGLGKTVQVVAFLEHLRVREQLRGPFLVIAPLSTMGHWRREFENWTDANVCFYYDAQGGQRGRDLIREYEWFYEKLGNRRDVCKFNVMLTTYETYIADVDEIAKLPFISVVIDEGHRLKNQRGKLLLELRRLESVTHRLLLSGTPLQNNLTELWSLLNYCEPVKFPSADAFLQRHANLRTEEDVRRLQHEIAPYMLRRVKEDVEKSIPPKEETIVDIELTVLQKKYYRAIFERNREFLYKGCKNNNKPQLINVEIELRKCCNHPYLIAGAREKETEELHQQFLMENMHLSEKEKQKKWAQEQLQRLIQTSGKLVLVDKLLTKLRKEGRKVLIFSQMVKMLDLLGEFLAMKGFQFERLDGSVQGNMRQAAIDRFSRPDSASFVFLLSTRAGGVGINLTAADTVIIFDSDWNPQNDAQAQARCHRIGQDKPVTIYRLVTKNSYEETMLDRAAKKLGLEQAVLGGGSSGQSGRELKPEDLERMLRLGAYHHLQSAEQDETDSTNFMNLDIETLLRTRTRKIKVDGIRGTVSLELTHNTTNEPVAGQQTTVVSSSGENVDVNDPDFWTKMLPKEETAQSLMFKLTEQNSISELRSDAEARFKFVKRVREMVEEILQLRERGDVIDFNRMDTMVSLLVQMASLQTVFGKDNADAARRWRLALEAAKERKSRAKARELQEVLSYDSGVYGDIEKPKKQHTVVPAQAPAATPSASPAPKEPLVPSAPAPKEAPWGFQSCHMCYDPTGSDLFPCKGKCMRAFHPGCYKVGLSSFSMCDECSRGCGKCMVCEKVGKEVEKDAAWDEGSVKKCAKPDCGRFFHKACLDKVDEKLVTRGIKGLDENDFYCPAHRCCKCGRGEGPSAGPVAVQCIRCYKAFHLCCMNATRTVRASKNLVVCPDHFKDRIVPLSDHTKYGELTKRKPVGQGEKEASPKAKRPKDGDVDKANKPPKKKLKESGEAVSPLGKAAKASKVEGAKSSSSAKKKKPTTGDTDAPQTSMPRVVIKLSRPSSASPAPPAT